MACGTRSILDAVFGLATSGETTYAHQLAARMKLGMLVLADRNFAAGHVFTAIHRSGA